MNYARYILAETLYRFIPFCPFMPVRTWLYRLCGLRLKGDSKILWGARFYNCVVNGFGNFILGESVYVAEDCFFDLSEKIYLKDGVTLSMGVRMLTHSAPYRSTLNEKYPRVTAPIVVEENAWICAYAIILPGVRIGKGAIVAAGSVVTQDVPDHMLVAGIPARIKKCL